MESKQDQLKQIFDILDRNGNGYVQPSEIKASADLPPQAEAALIEAASKQPGGKMSFGVFCDTIHDIQKGGESNPSILPPKLERKASHRNSEEYKQIFDILDRNGDGLLQLNNLDMASAGIPQEFRTALVRAAGLHSKPVEFEKFCDILNDVKEKRSTPHIASPTLDFGAVSINTASSWAQSRNNSRRGSGIDSIVSALKHDRCMSVMENDPRISRIREGLISPSQIGLETPTEKEESLSPLADGTRNFGFDSFEARFLALENQNIILVQKNKELKVKLEKHNMVARQIECSWQRECDKLKQDKERLMNELEHSKDQIETLQETRTMKSEQLSNLLYESTVSEDGMMSPATRQLEEVPEENEDNMEAAVKTKDQSFHGENKLSISRPRALSKEEKEIKKLSRENAALSTDKKEMARQIKEFEDEIKGKKRAPRGVSVSHLTRIASLEDKLRLAEGRESAYVSECTKLRAEREKLLEENQRLLQMKLCNTSRGTTEKDMKGDLKAQLNLGGDESKAGKYVHPEEITQRSDRRVMNRTPMVGFRMKSAQFWTSSNEPKEYISVTEEDAAFVPRRKRGGFASYFCC